MYVAPVHNAAPSRVTDAAPSRVTDVAPSRVTGAPTDNGASTLVHAAPVRGSGPVRRTLALRALAGARSRARAVQ